MVYNAIITHKLVYQYDLLYYYELLLCNSHDSNTIQMRFALLCLHWQLSLVHQSIITSKKQSLIQIKNVN